MNRTYNVKFQCDVKGEMKKDGLQPTTVDVEKEFQQSLLSLTHYYDRLTGSNYDADIVAKATVEKLPWGYVWEVTLKIDGAKHIFNASIDNNTPLKNPMAMVAQLHKKLVNQMHA